MHPQSVRRESAMWHGRHAPTQDNASLTRWLVLAGVVMFLLYLCMDVTATLLYGGYSYRDQTISELSAIGAPTRRFWIIMSIAYQVLLFAFAAGVLRASGRSSLLRIIAVLVIVWSLTNLLWWFGPMHRREVPDAAGGDWHDTLHLTIGGITSLLFFAIIGVGSFAFDKAFRWYSFGTLIIMLVFGALMNTHMKGVANDEPTPWLGVYERLAIEGAMLWLAVFSARLAWGPRAEAQN